MYKNLFERGKIGNVVLKNRIFKPAAADFGTMDGYVPESMLRFYGEEARGGTGLIIVGIVDPDTREGSGFSGHCKIENDKRIPGLGNLAQVIHDNGAKACLQMTHFGSHGEPYHRCVSVDGIEHDHFYRMMLMPKGVKPDQYAEYTAEEIHKLVGDFGDAAVRARIAGFDMIEIHGAHLHGVGQFLSPLTNKRTDEYGGSLENRNRFLYEIIEDIQKKVGKNYPISVRLNGEEGPGGVTLEDTIATAVELEKMGVAAINISSMTAMAPMQVVEMGTNVRYAAEVKKAVNIPVLVAGSMNTPEIGEETIASGKADFVGTARALYADPNWPKKAREGHAEDITPCIRCLECVNLQRASWHGNLMCTMNPRVGKEDTLHVTLAKTPKTVAVVGAGPAGMEAALVCADRGHKVTLFEKRCLGGMVQEASVPPFKADLKRLLSHYERQLGKSTVTVRKEEATVETLKAFDTVIVATGAKKASLCVPGVDLPHVHNAIDALMEHPELGEHVTVVGGGSVGVEVAIMAAQQGKKVTILEMADHLMNGEDEAIAGMYYGMLEAGKVEVLKGFALKSIEADKVTAASADGHQKEILSDTVLMSVGLKADLSLYDQLAEAGMADIYFAGDCEAPKKIFDAIHAGFTCACQV